MVIPNLPIVRPRYLRAWQITDVLTWSFGIYLAHKMKFPEVRPKIGYFRSKRMQQADKHQTH